MPHDAAPAIVIVSTDDPRKRFPRSARVRTRAEYSSVFDGARRVSDPLMTLHWLKADTPARLGLAVSRKVDARAVGRNRIKRVLRDAMRHLRPEMAGGDFVVVAAQAGLVGHIKVGSQARIGAQAGVMNDVPAATDVVGSPAWPARETLRAFARLRQLAATKRDGTSGGTP